MSRTWSLGLEHDPFGGSQQWMRMSGRPGGGRRGASSRGAGRGGRGAGGRSSSGRGGRGHGRGDFPPRGFDPRGGDWALWNPRSGGRRRVGRGDVRAAVLTLLAEGPHNGYEIIQEVAERSGGVWRPSAGSVYPVLQQLEDEGLARPAASGKRKVMELTDEGRTYVEEHADEIAAPWEAVRARVGDDAMEGRHLLRQVFMAAAQVQEVGSSAQAAEMRQILTETRRSLYRILAEGDDGEADVADAAEDEDQAEDA